MRTVLLAAAVVALTIPTGAGSQQASRTAHLDGKWLCVRIQTKDGLEPKDVGWVMTIAGTQVSWKTAQGQHVGPFTIRIDPDAKPAQMDFNGVGIYRLDADTLVLCWWSLAEQRQATFDLPSQNPPGRVFTFRRVKN